MGEWKNEHIKSIREKKRRQKNLGMALVLCAAIVSGAVAWKLILPAIAMTQQDMVCGQEEHTHSAECYDTEGNLICGKEEHTHSEACYADGQADLETSDMWEASFKGVEFTGSWNEDLAAVAKTQLGYTESTENFRLSEDGTNEHKGYNRYGAFIGSPYSDWNAAFAEFCLHYAKVDAARFPVAFKDSNDLMQQLQKNGYYKEAAAIETSAAPAETTGSAVADVTEAAETAAETTAAAAETAAETPAETTAAAIADGAAETTAAIAETAAETTAAAVIETAAETPAETAAESPVQQAAAIGPEVGNLVFLRNQDETKAPRIGIITGQTEKDGKMLLMVIEGDSDNSVKENEYGMASAEILGYGLLKEAYSAEQPAEPVTETSASESAAAEETAAAETTEAGTEQESMTEAPTTENAVMPSEEETEAVTEESAAETEEESPASGATVTVAESKLKLLKSIRNLFRSTQTLDAGNTGSAYDIKGNITNLSVSPKKDSYQVGENISVSIDYKITNSSNQINSNCKTLYYKLPQGIGVTSEQTGTAYNENKEAIGTYVIGTDGIVKVILNDDYVQNKIQNGSVITGNVYFSGKVASAGSGNNGEIAFDGTNTTIKVARDLELSKSGGQKQDNGNYKYTINVSSKSGTGTDKVKVEDTFGVKNGNDFNGKLPDGVSADYRNIKVTKIGSNGNVISTSSGKSFPMELEPLQPGEKYEITYESAVTDNRSDKGDGSLSITNKASADSGNVHKEVTSDTQVKPSKVYKSSGNYDPVTGEVTWKIQVQNLDNGKIAGTTVKDIPGSGHVVQGSVQINKTPIEVEYTNDGGFTYTFPESYTGNYYEIVYKTTGYTVPEGQSIKVSNTAVITTNGTKYTDTEDSWISYRGWGLNKTAAEGNITPGDLDADKTVQRKWNVELTIPQNGTQSVVYEDTMVNLKASDGTFVAGSHYVTVKSIKDAIGNSMQVDNAAIDSNKYTVTYEFKDENGNTVSDDNAKAHSFKVTITAKNGQTITAAKISFDYTSVVDMSKADEKQQYTITNTGKLDKIEQNPSVSYTPDEDKPVSDNNDLKKELVKDDPWNPGCYMKDDASSIDFLASGGILTYRILVKNTAPTNQQDISIQLTDHMDPGMQLVPGSIKGYFCNNDQGNFRAWDEKLEYLSYSQQEADGTVQFSLTKNWRTQEQYNGVEWYAIVYQVSVKNDTAWDVKQKDTVKVYQNRVTWNDEDVSINTKVERHYKELDKSSAQMQDQEGKWTNQVQYSVVINPGAQNLDPDKENLTLTDQLQKTSGNGSAEININDIHLYSYDEKADGFKGTELSSRLYSVTYDKASGSMTVTLPDELACVLEYSASVSLDDPSKGTTLSNTISLHGSYADKEETKISVNDSGASLVSKKLTVFKVDSENYLYRLPGAKFKLEKWNGSDFSVVKSEMVTDGEGKLDLTQMVEYDTVYRLTETEAPNEDYKKSDTPYYFILQSSKTDEEVQQLIAASEAENVQIMSAGGGSIMVPNEYNKIQISKTWLDKDGYAMINPPDSITCKVYKAKEGFNFNIISQKCDHNGAIVDVQTKQIAAEEGNNIEIKLNSGLGGVTYTVTGGTAVVNGNTIIFTPDGGKTQGSIIISKGYNYGLNLNYNYSETTENGKVVYKNDTWDAGTITYYQAVIEEKTEVETIKLTKENGWYYELSGMTPGYAYSIQEVKINEKLINSADWTVSYRNNDGIYHGEISITNRYTGEEKYELPETGGIGTAGYTAGGMALMMASAALLYGHSQRSKRERRHR